MLNYAADPNLLQPYVPAGTILDAFQGRTYLSLVGFLFLDTRVLGLPVPFHRNFEEVNLRFYVRREETGGTRRGVVFLREIVPRVAIAWTARALYNEQYVARPMRHEWSDDCVSYSWRSRGHWNRLSLAPQGEALQAEEGSEEQFITEHYWGYAAQRDGGSIEYRVEHPKWNVQRAPEAEADIAVAEVYGAQFASCLAQKPTSAFLADGSEVRVSRPRRIC